MAIFKSKKRSKKYNNHFECWLKIIDEKGRFAPCPQYLYNFVYG